MPRNSYHRALANFPDLPRATTSLTAPIAVTGSQGPDAIAFGSASSIPTCNCQEQEKCVETLHHLLGVLYAQNKFCSAIAVYKALLADIQKHATGPNDPALVAAKANYKKLIKRVETNKRWPRLAPLFKQYKFVGMDRTRVHEILGTPDAAAQKDSSGWVGTWQIHRHRTLPAKARACTPCWILIT
ncbi:MAG TPA: hypothetical protein V6D08_17970 [Candidatus Obscuribacterales bacterium]